MAINYLLKALADETRLEIVRFLIAGKKNATQIVSRVKKSQPNTSLALKQLLLTRVIEQEKKGREVYYRLRKLATIKKFLEDLEELDK